MLKYILIILLAAAIVYFGNQRNLEHFYNGASNIAGQGLFCSKPATKYSRLFKALDLDHKIRDEVRKVNHCNRPNTYLQKENDGWWVYAKRNLVKDEELTIDYWDTPNFIRKPEPEWTC